MNNRVKTVAVVAGLIASLSLGNGVHQVLAGCTNYGDYLHWISKFTLTGSASNVWVQGDYAYTAAYDASVSTLYVVDISTESAPVTVGTVDIPSRISMGIAVAGNTALIGCETNSPGGLYIMDVTDPTAPALVDSLLNGIAINEVAVRGTVFYATSYGGSRLYIIDLADPANPVLHPSVAIPGNPWDMVIKGDYLYLAAAQLVTVNISDPANAQVVDTDAIDSRNICDIGLYQDHLFVSTRHVVQNSMVYVYDIVNPANPGVVSWQNTTIPGGAIYPRLTVAAGVCYVGYSSGYIQMYDVSNLPGIVFDGYLPHPGGYLRELSVFGSNLYNIRQTTDSTGTDFHIISVSSPSPLEPISSLSLPGETLGVVLSPAKSNLAYVAGGTAGVQIVDISDPLAPVLLGTADTPGQATEIVLSGSLAYVADGDSGLQVVDVTNSAAPSVIGSVDTPGQAVDLAVAGSFAYLADNAGGLRIVDVTTSTAPTLRGAEITLTAASGVDVAGGIAFVANGDGGVKSVDVSDPDNPWVIDGVKAATVSNALNIDVSQGKAYVSDRDQGLAILDVSDPSSLQVLSGLGTEYAAGDVDVWGIFAYVGSGSGVQLVDIRDAQNPLNIGKVNVPATSQGMCINQYYAYVATGASGLQICPTQCGFDEMVFSVFDVDVPSGFHPLAVHFTNQSIGYGLSYVWDFGDGVGTSTEANPTYLFSEPGDYQVTLTATNGTNVDVFTMVISALAEPATITAVRDVPNDQGGWVYVDFYHSGYDTGTLSKSELYTIQRQDDGVWVSLGSIGAYGDPYYTALAPTPGDGSQDWSTSFRVIANMEEGNWASAPVVGHSLDNIAPQAPQNVVWTGTDILSWDPVPDSDFAYYRVYGSISADFSSPVSLATTVQTQADLAGVVQPWVFVVAVDHAQQESQASSPVAVSAAGETPRAASLSRSVPNPFNPRTTIHFEIPTTAGVRLQVFDMAGRLLTTLVDETYSAGRHAVVWHGQDSAGQDVASGTYFYRLETGRTTLTQRMVLVR